MTEKAKTPTKTKSINSREWAIEELNRFFDTREVLEEDRLKISLNADQLKALEFMTEEEAQLEKEKSDFERETAIKAIRLGRLKVDDYGSMTYTLKKPVTDKQGNVKIDVVKLADDYQISVYNNNMLGINSSNAVSIQLASQAAKVASRIGRSRLLVEAMNENDYETLRDICGLFM